MDEFCHTICTEVLPVSVCNSGYRSCTEVSELISPTTGRVPVVLCKRFSELINCANRLSGFDIVLLFHYIASYIAILKELGAYLFVAYLTS